MSVLIFHVVIALTSVVYTTYLAISPVASKFKVAYSLVGLTVASGTYLVVSTHSPLLQSCVTGLCYLAVAGAGIVAAHYRLASTKADTSE